MQQYVNLKINNVPVRAVKGASVLDAAISNAICIPHLCHIPGLSDIGACRLCIVENIKTAGQRLQPPVPFLFRREWLSSATRTE